jgi:hypothetical protein
MFDPFAEKAFDAHSAALLRARPKPPLSPPTPPMSRRHSPLGVRVKQPNRTPVEFKGLRKLFETPHKK